MAPNRQSSATAANLNIFRHSEQSPPNGENKKMRFGVKFASAQLKIATWHPHMRAE